MFMRSVGSAVGVAIFGAIANSIIASSGGKGTPSAIRDASGAVFLATLVAALLGLVAGLFMPQARAEDLERSHDEPVAEPQATAAE
jgi:hypothetical protein